MVFLFSNFLPIQTFGFLTAGARPKSPTRPTSKNLLLTTDANLKATPDQRSGLLILRGRANKLGPGSGELRCAYVDSADFCFNAGNSPLENPVANDANLRPDEED
jgi:hypothetical protein